MSYREDSDLEFLSRCSSAELNDLVECLTRPDTEELTSSENYKEYAPDHCRYWKDIAAEIQKFGGNTIVNIFRGTGVPYREVLCDVCDKLKVNYNESSSVRQIEENMLMKIVKDSLEQMTDEEREKMARELSSEFTSFSYLDKPTVEILLGAFMTAFRAGGFTSYRITLVVVNAIWRVLFSRGLTVAANATITRVLGVAAGPIGWGIMGAWTLLDIAGPAYRATIPATIQVALLRKAVDVK